MRWRAASDSLRSLAGIERRAVGIARPRLSPCLEFTDRRFDRTARQESRIDQIARDQLAERLAVEIEMLRLPPHRLFPVKSQPFEIGDDPGFEFRRGAGNIDILDPQEEASVLPFRHVMVENGRERMAEMQLAVRAWCKAEDRLF